MIQPEFALPAPAPSQRTLRRHGIEWTEATWNPTTGCSPKSWGCTNCFAQPIAWRLMHIAATAAKYRGTVRLSGGAPKWTGVINTILEELDKPYTWTKPSLVFVNSMSDMFHEDMPIEFIKQVFRVMADTPRHTYQVLTKRAERLDELAGKLPPWPENVWMGVSVESQDYLWRFDHLARTQAAVKFISYEPALGPVSLNGRRPDWVIFGGESGPKKRHVDLAWARVMRDECVTNGISFFMKQVDKVRPIPDDLMIRQFPQ